MTSFATRRFYSEIRVAAEELVAWIRWDFLPELPSKMLFFGSIGFFIWCAYTVEPKDLNVSMSAQTAISAGTCEIPQSDGIAISH